MKTRITACILCTAVLASMLTACGSSTVETAAEEPAAAQQETAQIQAQGKCYYSYFDTVSYIYSYAGDSAEQFDERCAGASAVLGEYHQLFDIYHEYTGINNLCTVNRNAGGDPIEVDRKLVDFLLYARELYELTDGEMNVMMGAVLSIWHEHREAASDAPDNASVPEITELEAAAGHIDFSLLEIDEEACTVRITDPQASIDVGALGKGYATEKAGQYLEDIGAYSYVLNIGGNIRIVGTKPDGTGWLTAIRNPNSDDDKEYVLKIRISDTACVTSGVYENYYTVDGVRYHHIIDRDTLYPSLYYSSLTVITDDSGLADALSTALFCMDYETGRELAESLDGVEILWVFPNGEFKYTSGFGDLIEVI